MPAPTKRDPHAVTVSTAASRRRHQLSHASHNRWTCNLIPAMETGVSSVTSQTLPPTLAATRMALPHGCSGWGGDGWNDTLHPRVQLRLTGWQRTNRSCASQSLTITLYRLGLIVYDIIVVEIFDRYRNIALSIRALNRMRIGRSRSSKVVDFGTNRKGVCDFLLVINSNFGPFAPFPRYGELLAENCEFFLPHSHLTPSLGVNPFEFLDDFFIRKTRVLGLSVGENFVILACVVFTQCQRVTDGQTPRS